MQYVQAYISNISFPTSIDEVYNNAHLFNMEMILGCDYYNLLTDDNRLDFDDRSKHESRKTSWTAPKWCKDGDIVFFMHSKSAHSKISALKTELISNKDSYSYDSFWLIMNALIRARKIHDLYGGKIFAIGKVCGSPNYYNNDDTLHWRSNIYAPINQVFLLERPIDISEFKSEILVSRQSSITPIFGEQFSFLKNLIMKHNNIIEDYFIQAVAEPTPISKVDDNNWLDVLNKYRRSFFLEIQFRSFYVDRFLKFLGDNKTFYRECACYKSSNPTSFVDNVIKLHSKYLPVEVKLSVSAEHDIISQLSKYCCIDKLQLNNEKCISTDIFMTNVLVIDTENIYLYDDKEKSMTIICKLDDINTIDDIIELHKKLFELLS